MRRLGGEEGKTMTKLTLEDLEAMRQEYGIAQEDLLEDLRQVSRLEEVGMRLERWMQLRGVPMEYAVALREYLDQEEEGTNPKGSQSNRPLSYVRR